jgi:hypothetical protein
MHTCNCSHLPWPHNGMYSKNNYFQLIIAVRWPFVTDFRWRTPKQDFCPRLISYPILSPFFYYFPILFRLPDNIPQHGSLLATSATRRWQHCCTWSSTKHYRNAFIIFCIISMLSPYPGRPRKNGHFKLQKTIITIRVE